jgi:hypothetical protein
MTNQTPEPRGPEFEWATALVDRFLAKPEVASDVAKGREARAEMNRGGCAVHHATSHVANCSEPVFESHRPVQAADGRVTAFRTFRTPSR